jgi:hypothetical protein
MFISFGLIDVGRILRTLLLALRFLGKPGSPLLRWVWLHEKDLSSTRPHETPEAKASLALIRADFISTSCFLDCSLTRLHLYLLFSRLFAH